MRGLYVASAEAVVAAEDFDRFYERAYAPTLRCVFALCGNWALAEEIVQDAFTRALGRWRTVGSLDQPDAWVRRVALNLATSAFRRRAAEARALLRVGSQPQQVRSESGDDMEWFIAAVRTLPRRQAQAVVLRYVDDLSIDQIADVMSCAAGTVKAHLAAARTRLVPLVEAEPRG